MARGLNLKVLMQLQTKEFQKGINNIRRQLEGFKGFIKSAFALGSITMFGREMVNISKGFEDSMARVKAVSNATTSEFEKMTKEAMRLGYTTRYTATEAAGALENLTRNGVSAENATKMLASVLQLAQANSIGLAEAANIVTNSLNMFNLTVDESQRVNDVLSSTASHAATDITSLYEAMANAAPAAKIVGFSIEETSAAIGAFAQRGIKGAEAGTKLRIAFQKMSDPKIVAKMKARGIAIDEETMKAEGLLKTIEKLANAQLSLGELGTIFDARSAMALAMLINSLDSFRYLLDVTANSAGTTERMFNQSIGSVQKELDVLKSKYQDLLISIGKQTSGVVKSTIRLLQNLIGNFKTVGGTIMNIASVIVPLLTKRIVQFAQTARTAFSSAASSAAALQAALGGWITIIASIVTWVGTALVGAWNRAHEAMREANKRMADAQEESARLALEVRGLQKEIGDGSDANSLNGAIQKAINLFPDFAEAINDARKIAEKTGEWEKLKQVLQDIADLQSSVLYADAAKAAHDAELEAFGKEMTKGTGWWGRNIFGGVDVEGRALFREIDRQLKERKMGDKKDVVANLIAKNIEDNLGDYAGTVKAISQTLDAWRLDYTFKEIEGLLQSYVYKTNREDSTKGDRPSTGKIATTEGTEFESVLNSLKEYNAADSVRVARAVELAEKILNDGLQTITKNDKASNEERYTLHQHYLDAILKAGLKEGSERVKNEREWLKSHSKWAPKPTTSNYNGDDDGDGGSGGSKAKTDSDRVSDAIKDYNENITKLNNRLSAGTISQKEYDEETAKLVDNTWEAITAISEFSRILDELGQKALGDELSSKYGRSKKTSDTKKSDDIDRKLKALEKFNVPKEKERDTTFDYSKSKIEIEAEIADIKMGKSKEIQTLIDNLKEGIIAGDFDGVIGEAVSKLMELVAALKKVKAEATDLTKKVKLSEAIDALDKKIKELQEDSFTNFTQIAQSFDRFNNSLMSVAEVFNEDLKDSAFFQSYEAFSTVINSTVQALESFTAIMKAVSAIEDLTAKKKVKDAAITVAANQAATESEVEKATASAQAAVAGAASSVASMPAVGWVLAGVAIAGIVAALMAAMNKFATGGIVGGNSYSGDKQVARLNSSEMVITRGQQAQLWRFISGGSKGTNGGEITFRLRGSDIVGSINNYNRLTGGR